jgi:lysophospholipase L1-like esterase
MKNIQVLFLLFFTNTIIAQSPLKYSFGSNLKKGFLKVLNETNYTASQKYGYLKGTNNRFFCHDLAEGNYDITITLGSDSIATETTIKVENRRLMLEKVSVPKGGAVQKTITVNIKTSNIGNGKSVELKPRELEYLHWDDKITYEISGKNAAIRSIEVRPNKTAKTIFLAGNSTVVDQFQEPFCSWGQMVPRFFKSKNIAISNHAESGESLKSFKAENRFEKIFIMMKKGDYLMIEFAHNDQKIKDFRPFIEYKNLLKEIIAETRQKGGIPILVTSMHRRNFDDNGLIKNTLGDFPEAVRQVATEENLSLIDLNAISKILWESLGVENSKKAFVHVPAGVYPGQDKEILDNTHFSNFGAYQLAKCVVEELKLKSKPLAKYLIETKNYNPKFPDKFEAWDFPESPRIPFIKPDGN